MFIQLGCSVGVFPYYVIYLRFSSLCATMYCALLCFKMFFINKIVLLVLINGPIGRRKKPPTVYNTTEKVSHIDEIFFSVILCKKICIKCKQQRNSSVTWSFVLPCTNLTCSWENLKGFTKNSTSLIVTL